MSTHQHIALEPGDHIVASRRLYKHHGIYVGRGRVIHYSGELARKADASVREDALATFASDAVVEVRPYASAGHGRDAVVARALSRVGERRYELVFNNCEHFARWCVTGEHASEQVRDVTSTVVGVSGAAAATAAGIGTVSATGVVVGLSGPGVMSGLAAAGGVVGGGALAGIAVLAAGPALVSTLAIRSVLADDPTLPEAERGARAAGRTAAVAGAACGVGASVLAVTAAGTATATGGAVITTGLYALGTTVGGGMASGVALTVGAPAVAAAAVGYGVYRAWKWLVD